MKINGLEDVIKKLKEIETKGDIIIQERVRDVATEIEREAKSNAPFGQTGKLGQGINATPESKDRWRISAKESYSAYVEFGTGARVKVPSGWEELAWKFYVNGKGYLPAQPYLIPAFTKYSKELVNRLKADYKKLTNES